jgi:hypothetical protein
MRKKKKSKRNPVPPIPQLSFEALEEVQKIERYAHQELRECQNLAHLNIQKAERILRTCTVHVLNAQLAYYQSLPTFHGKWIIRLQEDAIESAVGMIPSGYEPEVYEHFRDVLWDTTYADLNPPKALPTKATEPRKPDTTFADTIRALRDECRLTTEELAEEVNLDARSVQRHIAGKTQPYARHLRAYEGLFSKLLERKVVINKMS